MSRFTSLATLSLALSLLIPSSSAAVGVGRFPCSDSEGNGDPSICANLDASGPRGSECVADAVNGGWFCGYVGASCDGLPCDYGVCDPTTFVCTGGLGDSCVTDAGPDDNLCLGNLWCTSIDGTGGDGTCGGLGASCGVGAALPPLPSAIDNDNACSTGNCDADTGDCGERLTGPSQGARSKRHIEIALAKRKGLCPASTTACKVGAGFECVNTATSLEQCGGCDGTTGGVDCSALMNVASVGCVAGVCEIWGCQPGYKYDSISDVCR